MKLVGREFAPYRPNTIADGSRAMSWTTFAETPDALNRCSVCLLDSLLEHQRAVGFDPANADRRHDVHLGEHPSQLATALGPPLEEAGDLPRCRRRPFQAWRRDCQQQRCEHDG